MAVTQIPKSQSDPSFPPVPLLTYIGRTLSQDKGEEKQIFGPGSLRSGTKSVVHGSTHCGYACVWPMKALLNLCSPNENMEGEVSEIYFPGGAVVKKKIFLPMQEMQEMQVQSLGREDPLK